jgi:hypothetical protein
MAISPIGSGTGYLSAALRAPGDPPNSPQGASSSQDKTRPTQTLVAQRAPTMLDPLSIMDRLTTAPPSWPFKNAPDFFGVPPKPMSPREIERSILQGLTNPNAPPRSGQLGPNTDPSTGIHSGLCKISGRIARDGLEPGPLGDPVLSPCNVVPRRR